MAGDDEKMVEAKEKMNQDPEKESKGSKDKEDTGPDLKWRILDMFIAYILLAPFVVAYWRGTWTVMDTYLAPNNKEISGWVSTVIGISIICTSTVLQELFKRCTRKMHYVGLTILVRVHIYVMGFGAVNLWRGVWMIWDHYSGKTAVSGGISFTIGVVGLALSRGVRNITAPPLVVVVDRNSSVFDIKTRFGTNLKVVWKYILDTLFTVVVIGCLVVFVWRGSWTMFDALVYPGSPKTALVSFITGFVISILFALWQFPAEYFSEFLSRGSPKRKYAKIIFEQFYWLIAFFGPLNVWRGYWMFMDLYLLPEQPVLSRWITHIVGYVGLTLSVNSMSVVVAGCAIDGFYPQGSGATLPIDYVSALRTNRRIFANAEEVESDQLVLSQRTKEALLANGESGHQNQNHEKTQETELDTTPQELVT